MTGSVDGTIYERVFDVLQSTEDELKVALTDLAGQRELVALLRSNLEKAEAEASGLPPMQRPEGYGDVSVKAQPDADVDATAAALPVIGAPFGGGFVGAIIAAPGGRHSVIVVSDKATGDRDALEWAKTYAETPGARSVTDGLTNCEAMNDAAHPVAQFCRALRDGGFEDWHVPAQADLMALFANLGPNHTTVEAFKAGGQQAFENDWHWSSTEYGRGFAWLVNFAGGGTGWGSKFLDCRVRAVRKVLIGGQP